ASQGSRLVASIKVRRYSAVWNRSAWSASGGCRTAGVRRSAASSKSTQGRAAVSAPPLSRKGQVQPLKRGSGVFDIIICGGHRERGGVTLTPSQWRQPSTRVPITVVQHSERHVVGEGMPLVDRENNLRIRGMWSSTPLGEYVRTLVAQEVLRYAELEYTDTIDDAGQLVRQVLGGVSSCRP